MARPHPGQNVSFQDNTSVPSRRAGRQDDIPPRPPVKTDFSKLSSTQSHSSTSPLADDLNYGGGYVDAANSNPYGFSSTNGADVRRKKSMVKPERERIDPGHRYWHYREHAADDHLDVQPSTTGNQPVTLRRGKSLLGRDSDQPEGGFLRRGTLRRRQSQANKPPNVTQTNRVDTGRDTGYFCLGNFVPGPKNAWMVYCYFLTICIPNWMLKSCGGKRTPEAQRAWREKVGICSIVALLMAAVGFLTFGFTEAVCGNQPLRIQGGQVKTDSVVINGFDYDFGKFQHPAVAGVFNGTQNPLYMDQWMAGGTDASFLFQNVNQRCYGVITPSNTSGIRFDASNRNSMAWYFPCNLHSQNGTSSQAPVNLTGITDGKQCHASVNTRLQFQAIVPTAEVYYTWGQVRNESRNLAVYKSVVLDMSLLQWLDGSQVVYPSFFDTMKARNTTFAGQDITALVERAGYQRYAECLSDIVQVGFVDSVSIGCVASDVVLYVSLVFILGAVGIKFGMALVFGWFLSWRLGNFEGESYGQRMKRAAEVEDWTEDIYRAAPGHLRPDAGKKRKTVFLPTTSRFSKAEPMLVNSRPSTAYGMPEARRQTTTSMYGNRLTPGGLHTTPPDSPMLHNSRSSTSLPFADDSGYSIAGDSNSNHNQNIYNCPFPLARNVVPQPAADFEPFRYPLVHSICLVTAYSESYNGLRTTIDSLATTDYPNSHKVILVVCDGIVKGSDSKDNKPTHELVTDMMQDFLVPPDECEPLSYIAIADGHKRHNKAKVVAGFYKYDNDTVEQGKQQRVPMIVVAKLGNDLERDLFYTTRSGKPGNRGKRDSQIVLMSFLQKVMFDERMTQFDYEFFNSIWRVTGVPPDKYETVLCVDADTKVFPDSLTRMNACMVNDPEIMGLCGETKIANKKESWVTMIQVFEYYISHHLAKAFESVFGGVTCLPGCFSMYRIKAPKGDRGYWVPILANPDICEHYSENVVDTLHKKNLLLLGEDRYLSTLMLKTFPKRKMMFCPQAVCKTQVPEEFRILLSQRRRWINSTVHNLFELMLVRDLCGTFCFSMQFVVFMDLVGTLVLPAAISFTLYVIIIAILPSNITHKEKPWISLGLLAAILGLPGVLIIVTTRKIAYVGWMLMYLLSLPIWNLVLPLYAYWHMDDFTWGETRKIQGESKEVAHGDKEGKFESSHIVMKRWVEFERERRWKSGTQSRDSGLYDVIQRAGNGSPQRYSVVSTSETFQSAFGTSESNPLFRQSHSFASMSHLQDKGDLSSVSQLALPVARGYPHRDTSPQSSESGPSQARHIERLPSDDPSSFSGHSHPSNVYSPDANVYSDEDQPILPPQHYAPPLNIVTDPNYTRPGQYSSQGMYTEPDVLTPTATTPATRVRQQMHAQGRGVSLVDSGPVPLGGQQAAHDPVRRVSRHQRRSSSRNHLVSPVSSASHGTLPPGAAPPSF